MVKLYASHNSEYFAVREPGRLHLYKDSFKDLTHRVHDQMAGKLIGLSNTGECFFRSEEGLFRLRREKGVRAERCHAVKGLDGSAEGGTLKGFQVRADGEQVAYEQVLPAQKFSSKLKRFLGQKSAQGDVGPRLHRFIVSQWSGRSSTCYFETVVDPRTSTGLIWWCSPDFGYLSVMERERDGRSLVRLIDILDESVVNELVVEGRLSRDRFLTSNGSVGFGLEKDGKRAFVIWTYSQNRYGVVYPKDSRVLHLAKDKVVFLSAKREVVVVKSYQNEVIAEVSLKALSDLGVQYLLSFNPRGSLELVTYSEGKLRVHHTDLESLPIDARRWELLGERRRAAQLEEAAEDVLGREEAFQDAEYQQMRRSELLAELGEQVAQYSGDSGSTLTVEDAVPELPALEDPVNAAPPLPPPLNPTPPPAPRPSIELEPVMGHQPPPPVPRKEESQEAVAEHQPVFSFSSRAEAQEALERLRMRYIAGELTREDYYNEKTLIENASSKLPKESEPTESSIPRTLDFAGE
jgi:hypothetical protein